MNSAYVSAAKPVVTGAVYRAAVGTTLPTNTTTDITEVSAWVELGYVSADGITNSNSPNSSDIVAWGGDVVYTASGEKPDTFQMTLLEVTNVNVLETVYGEDNVSGTLAAGIAIEANNDERANYSYIIDMILRDGAAKRIVIPSASIKEVGEVNYKHDDATGYQITLNCEPDSSGNTHYEYILAAS